MKRITGIFTAIIVSASLFLSGCTAQDTVKKTATWFGSPQGQATISDAFAAGALFFQVYKGSVIPADSLKTGNDKVDKYLATATTALTSPVSQKLANDIAAIASSQPTAVPTVAP